jgi:AdoMet-dependent rRNA methyltransferase SPB1
MSQINRKFPILQNAKVVLDLCAAPGGWSQVAARTMPKQGSLVVAVDILPIRSLGPNVITLIGDITTESCKAEIKQHLQGHMVDVVLHDGAPNVGSSYDRDAYVQNEIALHSLKCATQHLKPHGHFVTKLYRSRDYQSFVWVAQQFFGTVQAVKPAASRSQSAEIFLVCQDYVAPTKIDPRILDPKHVFAQVEGDSTGGGNVAKKLNVFHKSWGVQKRHREGYDHTDMDFTMRKIQTVREFMGNRANPIDILSSATGLKFQCEECLDETKKEEDCNCYCQFYRQHKLTTPEIKACVSDLRVLNKSDFKSLLVWRGKLQDSLKILKAKEAEEEGEEVSKKKSSRDSDHDNDEEGENDDDDEEEEVQKEISALRNRRLREKKKIKKKERAVAAKRRRRAAFGMDLNAIDVPEHDQIFSLATISSKGELEAVREVDLDKVTHDEVFGADIDDDEIDEESVQSQGEKDDRDEETGYSYRIERELDEAYNTYLSNTKDGLAKSGTKMAKRSKKLQRLKAAEEAELDQDMMMNNETGIDYDTKVYAKMLQGAKDSDDDDSVEEQQGEDSDGYDDEPLTPEEHSARAKAFKLISTKSENPLIHKLEEATSEKTARWFSNPLFESIGNTAKLAALPNGKKRGNDDGIDSEDEADDEEEESEVGEDIMDVGDSDDEQESPKKKAKTDQRVSKGLDADDVLASMPKTDKQVRHEKRMKASERQERRAKRKARLAGEEEELELVPQEEDDAVEQEKIQSMTDAQKKKHFEARALIKAGLGGTMDADANTGFEVVAAAPLPKIDSRVYNSDNEDYDSDDYARTLALGTMMLRQSKAKQLVDASYNRYAWNDPEDLPDWLVDDENRHYRPQLPIPPALLQKLKDKQMAMSVRPIAKVAEARARKSKRAKTQLQAAKKKAAIVANSSEISDTMKLKAISKAMRGQDAKKPGKTYVIAKKGRNLGAKGVKLVDKRMKQDKRAMERKVTTAKKGKQNGLVGHKKRRSHS